MKIQEIGGYDFREYNTKRKWLIQHLEHDIPGIAFEANSNRNHPKRIVSNDELTKKLVMQMVEDNATQASEPQLDTLKRASTILRSISLEFLKLNPSNFKGSITSPGKDVPLELEQFITWILTGTRDLNETLNEQVKCLSNSLAQTLIGNIKSDRQAEYKAKHDYNTRKVHQSRHQIGLAMSLRNSDRNNQIINLLSAPGYGLTIPAKQAILWETRIANAVIDQMNKNQGIYIPINFQKNVIPMFHLDNIDWLEDSADGKKTSHLLQLSAFQPNNSRNLSPFILDLNTTKTCTLKTNNFNELLECNKPRTNDVTREPDHTQFNSQSIDKIESPTMNTWTAMKSFEVLLSSDHANLVAEIGVAVLEKIPPCPVKMRKVYSFCYLHAFSFIIFSLASFKSLKYLNFLWLG